MKNKTKIPKIIHYVWVGGNPLTKSAKRIIKSWEKYCSDYQIMRWNENNFDMNSYLYAREAYNSKKFAFVSDVIRLHALYEFGGIYMDTDVEVLKSLDPFLNDDAFSGFETNTHIPTGIIGAKKGHAFIKELLNWYIGKKFINSDGTFNLSTNVLIMTEEFRKKGLLFNDKKQTINDFTLYPRTFFCPIRPVGFENHFSKQTSTIHWFNGSWLDENKSFRREIIKWGFRYKLTRKIWNILDLLKKLDA
ncbi:MAG: glycosyl transferase [Streptococcaceae bacterium]|jgi:hypothetical protein|nr:glycosyl transferase [Streptococcaceae bacterium]